jgi:hypothetical protein
MFLSSANLLHPLIFNSNKESHLILSFHFRRGLPTGPLPWYFPISSSVGLLVLSIRTAWPAHRHLLHVTRNICHYISVYSCSLRLGLHPTAFPRTGPNIFLSTLPAFLLMSSHCPALQPVILTVLYKTTTPSIFCVSISGLLTFLIAQTITFVVVTAAVFLLSSGSPRTF